MTSPSISTGPTGPTVNQSHTSLGITGSGGISSSISDSTPGMGNRSATNTHSGTKYSSGSSSSPFNGELSHYDRYGFKKQNNYITEEEYDAWWEDYSRYCIKRKKKWENYLVSCGLPLDDDSPVNFPSNCEKLKRYIRKGIPAEWRGNAWWYFARGDEKLSKNRGVYDKLVDTAEKIRNSGVKNTDFAVIENDLGRTFPDNLHFRREPFQQDDPIMVKSLRRVLSAFSLYDTNIGYCQSMNFIAGLLLLFMPEERTFWMLVIITRKYLPGVHSVNLEGVNIDQGVLALCIREYLPDIWKEVETSYLANRNQENMLSSELQASGGSNARRMGRRMENEEIGQNYMNSEEFLIKLPPITLSTASWFMSCFIGTVPIETTLRIWDCLFYEKSHFLFKTSLAILKLSEHELLDGRNSPSTSLLSSLVYNVSSESLPSKSSRGAKLNRKRQPQRRNQDDFDILMFQVIQTFPKKLINPNELFDRVLLRKKISLNNITQEEIDLRRKYVISQREKLKHFNDTLNKTGINTGISGRVHHPIMKGHITDVYGSKEYSLSANFVYETISSEVDNFRKVTLNSINWNNSIKKRVRQMRQNK